MAKSDKKADKKTADKAKVAKTAAASPAKAKSLASSKEILAKAKVLKASNGKASVKRANDESSDDSSDSSSEDEQPKKTVLTSDSDDSSEEKKPASTPASKKGKSKVEIDDSSDSSSSDESSSDEVRDKDVVMQDVQPANGKKTDKTKAAKPTASPGKKVKLPTSSKDILAKAGALKASIAKASQSSDESSDSSSEGEPPKKAAPASDSDDSSDDEKPASVPGGKKGKGKESGDSSDSSSDESSSDQDGAKGTEVQNAQPAKGTKRKAEAEPSVPPKKVKLVDGDGDAAPSVSSEETKSIFVGRLSWNIDNDWLAQEFASCGEVVSAQVQTDRATGKSRGFGYVHFASADAVEKALQMNGKEIDGRPVNIDKSTPPDKSAVRENRAKSFGDTQSPVSSVLFVGNLSFGVNEDQLWEVFGEHGDVKSVRVPTDRDSGRPKGFAYVEFSVVEAAQTAHGQLQGYELDGRSLRLDYSQPRDNAGGGRGGGRGGFGDRGRGRGGFGGGDRGRGRGGFGGDRGGRGRGRGGDRGGRGGGRGRGGARTGAVTQFEGSKITFD
ncbi:hypothetical protein EV424DRAFT_1349683 [Suillus variegatus]|nr:hypothetical protein EV424DRAFT_1349683 [Suillus variegatus]